MIVKFVACMKKFKIFMLSLHTGHRAVTYTKKAMEIISNHTCIVFREIRLIKAYKKRHVLLITNSEPRFGILNRLRRRRSKFGFVFLLDR